MEVDNDGVLSPVAIQPEIREEIDIPSIIPIRSQVANPDDVQVGGMEVEIPSTKHKRTHKGQIYHIQDAILSAQPVEQKPNWELMTTSFERTAGLEGQGKPVRFHTNKNKQFSTAFLQQIRLIRGLFRQ
jgi:hypothetical protein